MIAARWIGWGSLVVVAVGAIVLGVDRQAAHPVDESWRDLSYNVYDPGGCGSTAEATARTQAAHEEAVAACMDAWGGRLAIRTSSDPVPRKIYVVEETSDLARCLEARYDFGGSFCGGHGHAHPPADATMHVPQHLGTARASAFDEQAYAQVSEDLMVADGSLLAIACPTTTSSRFVGLPDRQLRGLWRCKRDPEPHFVLRLDETGTVERILVWPRSLADVPCALANACGVQFAGMGGFLIF